MKDLRLHYRDQAVLRKLPRVVGETGSMPRSGLRRPPLAMVHACPSRLGIASIGRNRRRHAFVCRHGPDEEEESLGKIQVLLSSA